MLRSLAVLLVLISSASAEVRYTIHPTDGEFVKTFRACGSMTRDELFNRVIKFAPDLIVDGSRTMTIIIKGNEQPADEVIEDVGWWHYDGKQQTKTMVISLKAIEKKPTSKVISIGVVRRMDEVDCSERWVGIVTVTK